MLSVYFMFIIVNLMHQAKRIESITTDTKFLSLRNYAIRVSPTERFFFNFFFFFYIYLLNAICWFVVQISSDARVCMLFESSSFFEQIHQHTSELTRRQPLTLNARNYISAPKIWPNHNLKFELKRQCYSLRLHTEEIWEKWVKKNHWFMLKIWLNVCLFWRKFRRPWWQHTVTLVIRVWLERAGSGKKRK